MLKKVKKLQLDDESQALKLEKVVDLAEKMVNTMTRARARNHLQHGDKVTAIKVTAISK